MRIAAVLSGMPDREEISGMLKRINPECEIVGTACDGAAGYEMICAVRTAVPEGASFLLQ